ncbi:MAG: alanyl-tRNA editing protein [Rhodospirillales bacterium]|jgi:misacylated tRNA(Ala) deacylase|nr:alanyl-tRNA editing protein [Rhodospirillales bacterium]MDP6646781.1 alanyl-tRNA editing protein [Rhodospirillales bacterium]MDP6840797.1 alanyl-tRNA editing protein [Rhodospirillales bacterium]
MTEEIFRADAYAKSCEALVIAADARGIVLDATVFYPMGGGQPGDSGVLRLADGGEIEISDCFKDRDTGDHIHVAADGAALPEPGTAVTAEIDWDRRHRMMRMHTGLHLLCAVIEGGVTGGKIGPDKSRLDFDLPDTSLDKEHIEAELNRLVAANLSVGVSSVSDDELAANPDLVRTMSVQPPTGAGSVRIIEVEGADLQPCGGTHVAATGEIGRLRVGKIENKGAHNRRVNIHLED